MRGLGNDTLTLTADLAYRIGLTKGTAETLDDLMDRMGLPRNYVVVRGRGNQILREWSKQIGDAESQINRLIRQYNDVRLKPPATTRPAPGSAASASRSCSRSNRFCRSTRKPSIRSESTERPTA